MRKFTLILGDIAILYGSLYITLLICYSDEFAIHAQDHIYPFTLIFPIWLVVLYIANIYDLTIAKNNLSFYRPFFYANGINGIIAISLFYLIPSFRIAPKTNFLIFFALSLILMALWRWIFNRTLRLSGFANNTLIIGASQQSNELYDFLLNNSQLGYNAVGILDVRDEDALIILEKLIRKKEIRTLVLSPETYRIPDIINILYSLLDLRITFHTLS